MPLTFPNPRTTTQVDPSSESLDRLVTVHQLSPWEAKVCLLHDLSSAIPFLKRARMRLMSMSRVLSRARNSALCNSL